MQKILGSFGLALAILAFGATAHAQPAAKQAADKGSTPKVKVYDPTMDASPAQTLSDVDSVMVEHFRALAAFGANHHLRQSLVFLDMPVLQQPEAYIGNAAALFDELETPVREGATVILLPAMAGGA